MNSDESSLQPQSPFEKGLTKFINDTYSNLRLNLHPVPETLFEVFWGTEAKSHKDPLTYNFPQLNGPVAVELGVLVMDSDDPAGLFTQLLASQLSSTQLMQLTELSTQAHEYLDIPAAIRLRMPHEISNNILKANKLQLIEIFYAFATMVYDKGFIRKDEENEKAKEMMDIIFLFLTDPNQTQNRENLKAILHAIKDKLRSQEGNQLAAEYKRDFRARRAGQARYTDHQLDVINKIHALMKNAAISTTFFPFTADRVGNTPNERFIATYNLEFIRALLYNPNAVETV